MMLFSSRQDGFIQIVYNKMINSSFTNKCKNVCGRYEEETPVNEGCDLDNIISSKD